MLKTQTLVVRTTKYETMALDELARREGLKKSEIVRLILRDAAKNAGLWPPVQKQEAIREHA